MVQFLKNTAGQRVQFQVNDTDGNDVTANVTLQLSTDGGALTDLGGVLTHLAAGFWDYVLTKAETNADHIGVRVSAPSTLPMALNITTVAGGGPYEHTAVPTARVMRLGRRHDGMVAGYPAITLRPGEKATVAFDASELLGDGVLDAINDATTNDANAISVVKAAVDHERALVQLDATNATDGDAVTLTATLTPTEGEYIMAKGTVRVAE